MKSLLAILTTILTWSSGARADHPAVHGMLLFGQNKTYASHLPMFHSPHDYQVILELSVSPLPSPFDPKSTRNSYFTLVPEPMDLQQVIQGTKTDFSAELFDGHFERGGTSLGLSRVHVSKVIYSAKLDAHAPAPQFDHYLVFGSDGEYYAAHMIESKPSFDAIVSVAQVTKAAPPCHFRFCEPDPAPVPVLDSALPLLVATESMGIASPHAGQKIGFVSPTAKIMKVIYYEDGDLAE